MSLNPYQATNTVNAGRASGADKGIRIAIWCGIVAALLVASIGWIVLCLITYTVLVKGIPLSNFISHAGFAVFLGIVCAAFVPLPIAFGIYKRSRICAAISWVAFLAIANWELNYASTESSEVEAELIVLLILIVLTFVCFAATILHHRRSKASEPTT